MKVKVISEKNKESKNIELSNEIFGYSINHKLLAQVIERNKANKRRIISHTKDKGEVSGGGRKPFRQKGTGRARAGSIRSPLWVGGGVTFGPRKDRNYNKRIPKKMAKAAVLMALSEKLKDKKLIVISQFNIKKIGANQIQEFLEKLPIEEGKILFVLKDTNVNLELSVANLPFVKVVQTSGVNLLDLINYDYLITDKEGIESIQENFRRKK